MFSGIIETIGIIKEIVVAGSNKSFCIECDIVDDLQVDQSIAHDGVCLTVEKIDEKKYWVTAIEETLQKTNLDIRKAEGKVNIERCIQMNGRLDGHIVQGHVDCVATCVALKPLNGSTEFTFEYPKEFASLLIEKGSIAVNGISLTCFNVTNNTFTVAIIPYTFEHTTIQYIQAGSIVNIEFDIIGKYINRIQSLK